jgi:hypothetical protein
MTPANWFDEEPPLTTGVRQAARLFVAGLKRPVILLAVAIVYGAALVASASWTKYSYEPEYVLRVVEPERDASGMPRAPRELAEYVRGAVFTSAALLDVMQRYNLYPRVARRDPHAALDSFREDIDVDVRENYFLQDRPAGAAPRSARLIIRYRNADPDTAVHVTHELGELVSEVERAMRKSESARSSDLAREQVDQASQALALRRSAVASMQAELDGNSNAAPDRRIAFIGLLGSLPALEQRLDQREKREAAIALGAELEQGGVGMMFTVVDDALLPNDTRANDKRAIVAGAAFVLGLPLLAVAVGAFSPRRENA